MDRSSTSTRRRRWPSCAAGSSGPWPTACPAPGCSTGPDPAARFLSLTDWRMHVAKDLLRSSDLGVAAVGRRVGYDSEEAFSRAFKRRTGLAPSSWRSSC
ncbi:helix-turn-helix transcriptional regulator [Blastococcus deserti]|uniref:Helix-turn-helix transcriptional regulator n=1 Tax=Blastococcus deserti TaxID=2259033 RepID=A0ABW4XG51_9ACTN